MAFPQTGDVLVSSHAATLDHDIRIVPNTPHLTCPTHDAAVARGQELARDLDVDLWLTVDRTHFMRIGSFRGGERRLADGQPLPPPVVTRPAHAQTTELLALAHDLRGALGVIEVSARLMQDTGAGGRAVDAGLERIRRAAHRAERLVQDLFDLATGTGGMFDLRLATVPACRLLADAEAVGDALASNASLTLEVDQASNLPPVRVDADRIAQVFENVIGNAVKHTPPGGRITIRAVAVDDEVQFRVADSGAGLSEEARGRAFRPYWQHDIADRRGLGLGLWICREIIEAHGGRIWIETGDAGGVTVVIALPGQGTPAGDGLRPRGVDVALGFDATGRARIDAEMV